MRLVKNPHRHQGLANALGIASLHLKDKRSRMGLGSFKALGAEAVVYLSHSVPNEFAQKLRDNNAGVVVEGKNYEARMMVAMEGPVSNMGRLDCKEPSHLALKFLAKEADWFMTISDSDASGAVKVLSNHDIETSPSGAAGIAGLIGAIGENALPGLNGRSRVLAYITEGAESD